MEFQFQPAPKSETLALPIDYEILSPGFDLVLADMFPGKYNDMHVDMNNAYLVSNIVAPLGPNLETSIITFVKFRSNASERMLLFTQREIQCCITKVCNLYSTVHFVFIC